VPENGQVAHETVSQARGLKINGLKYRKTAGSRRATALGGLAGDMVYFARRRIVTDEGGLTVSELQDMQDGSHGWNTALRRRIATKTTKEHKKGCRNLATDETQMNG
jgi:hypothetical protein